MSREPIFLFTDSEQTNRYIDALALSIDHARLNDLYPPVDDLINSLDMMMPEVHLGLHPTLEVHAQTGLPTYKEFVRVSTDWHQAIEELPQIEKWKCHQGDDIYGKLARKCRYYETLTELTTVHSERQKIYFRKIDKTSAMALFRVVLDRITPKGYLERVTVEMSQKHQLWGDQDLKVTDHDAVEMSESLKGIVYRMASQDADVIFFRLRDNKDIGVSCVVKSKIGPFVYPDTVLEEHFTPLYTFADRGFLLTISMESADVTQLADVFNDPFKQKANFSKEVRASLFHVLTDRKFVLTNADKRSLAAFCETSKTSNLIYEVQVNP